LSDKLLAYKSIKRPKEKHLKTFQIRKKTTTKCFISKEWWWWCGSDGKILTKRARKKWKELLHVL